MASVRRKGRGQGREEAETCSALGLLIGSKKTNLPLIAEVSTESSESPKVPPAKENKAQGAKASQRLRPRHRPASLSSSSAIIVTAIGFADPRHPARCVPAPIRSKGRFHLSGLSFCQYCRTRVTTEVAWGRTVKGKVWVLRCVECLGVISKLS